MTLIALMRFSRTGTSLACSLQSRPQLCNSRSGLNRGVSTGFQGLFRRLCLCPAKSRFPTAETGVDSGGYVGRACGRVNLLYGGQCRERAHVNPSCDRGRRKKGTVTIEKEGTEIAKVTEPGAVFGELSVVTQTLQKSSKARACAHQCGERHFAASPTKRPCTRFREKFGLIALRLLLSQS